MFANHLVGFPPVPAYASFRSPLAKVGRNSSHSFTGEFLPALPYWEGSRPAFYACLLGNCVNICVWVCVFMCESGEFDKYLIRTRGKESKGNRHTHIHKQTQETVHATNQSTRSVFSGTHWRGSNRFDDQHLRPQGGCLLNCSSYTKIRRATRTPICVRQTCCGCVQTYPCGSVS